MEIIIKAEPGMITNVIMGFKEYTGDYLCHCHILKQEDNEMVRPIRVIRANKETEGSQEG